MDGWWGAGALESQQAERRWHIIHTHKAHPDWSYRRVATTVGADHKTVKHWIAVHKRTGTVNDQPRSGRKSLLSQSDVLKIKSIALKQHTPAKFSAFRLSSAVQAEGGASTSARTLRRHLRAAGWKYGYAKKALLLTASHKAKRLAWATKHLRKQTSFSRWMFTDSKVFLLHRDAGKAGVKVWYPRNERPSCAVPKRSNGLHAYLGVCQHGVTRLIFVTGGGSQKSGHIDPSNPRTDKAFVGVSAVEYQKDVLPKLIQDGNVLFAANSRWGSEWILQQDNARPHVAASTTELLQELLPGRVELEWPAMSPDLSWIEKIWAWAEQQLATFYSHVQTIAQLKAALNQIFSKVPHKMLQNYVRGMRKRLRKMVAHDGGQIS